MASDLSFLDDAEKAAVCAARSAGDILRSYWEKGRESFSVEFKSSTDLVTEADKKSEAVVMATLRRLFARDAAFLCEESGASEAKGEGAQYRWIVDPLDGTTSFTHNHPFFSVSIALEYRGVIVLGVVYGVVLDEMYVARKGQGAKCNGKPISVTKTDKLINSLMATGFPTFRAEIKNDRIGNNMAYFEELLMKVRDVRRNGSAALDLCFVACGRHDFYFEQYLKAWDVSAAHLMVEEAGGKFSDFHGKPISYAEAKSENDKYAVFGSNGHVHAAVLESFDAARRAHAAK